MKKQKVMFQMKRQGKIPEKQLNEVEMGNFPEKEFKIKIVKMIKILGNRMEKMKEMFIKGELKKKQTEMKNTLEGINSRIIEAEEWINDLEDRMVEIIATEQNIGKKKRKEMKTA